MRLRAAFAIAFAALGVALAALSCGPGPYGYASSSDVPPATCHRTYSQTFDATEFTDSAEQAQLVKATNEWRKLSNGQIDMIMTFDPTQGATAGGTVRRMLREDAETKAYEAAQIQKGNIPEGDHILGWTSGQTVHLVVDGGVGIADLWALAAHETGHAADLRWPACFLPKEDCIHSPDPHAVMAPAFPDPVPADLTPSDLALCRASCRCP